MNAKVSNYLENKTFIIISVKAQPQAGNVKDRDKVSLIRSPLVNKNAKKWMLLGQGVYDWGFIKSVS